MRSEASKNTRYGSGRPPLGDNEEDEAVCALRVSVCLPVCVCSGVTVGMHLEVKPSDIRPEP